MEKGDHRWFLREWRKYRKLSQERLAHKIGRTQGLISQLETGESDFTGELLRLLASALDCQPADLLERNPFDPVHPDTIWRSLSATQRRQGIRLLKALKDDDDGVDSSSSMTHK